MCNDNCIKFRDICMELFIEDWSQNLATPKTMVRGGLPFLANKKLTLKNMRRAILDYRNEQLAKMADDQNGQY